MARLQARSFSTRASSGLRIKAEARCLFLRAWTKLGLNSRALSKSPIARAYWRIWRRAHPRLLYASGWPASIEMALNRLGHPVEPGAGVAAAENALAEN